jgi:hypothetical protein
VECGFGLLKKRFNILAIPGQSYSQLTLELIMRACIILHNMIINDERDGGYDDNYHIAPPSLLQLSITLHRLVSQAFFKGRRI